MTLPAIRIGLLLTVVLIMLSGCSDPLDPGRIVKDYSAASPPAGIAVKYPLNGTIFPPDIVAPTIVWEDRSAADLWVLSFRFQDGGNDLNLKAEASPVMLTDTDWQAVTAHAAGRPACLRVIGIQKNAPRVICSAGTISISTAREPVGAPIFYREVNLPFIEAVKDPTKIVWRCGGVGSREQPPVVLEGLPVCGNCHSFSADGKVMGMDVDYANDKGSYAMTAVAPEMILARSRIFTWSDYRKEDGDRTFGLLSQVSPCGRYALSTVKDRSVFVPVSDLMFSQLFFPVKGILAWHDRQAGTFGSLPGADDPEYVQSNPCWSPDGRYILFARAKSYDLQHINDEGQVVLAPEECREFLEEGRPFKYDLYRVPWNEGRGGTAEPIAGASANGMSNYFGRYSPDGQWIVFCKAANYMLLQPDAELWIIPAVGGEARRLDCNTYRMNSWHSWSPNSRWLVFSSKANTPFTQLFLTYISTEGVSSPPVLLSRFTSPDRAANIPEFVNTDPSAAMHIRQEFVDDASFVRAGNARLEYERPGDAEAAIADFRKAIAINPENDEAWNCTGYVLIRLGRTEEGRPCIEKALELNPGNAYAHNHMGILLEQEGQTDEAMAHYREAMRLAPFFPEPYSNLCIALAVSGQIAEAEELCLKAVGLAPGFADAWNNLGVICNMTGRTDEAEVHFRKALEVNPAFGQAQANLEELEHRRQVKEAMPDPGDDR